MLSASGLEMYTVYLSRTGSRFDALRIRYGDVNGLFNKDGFMIKSVLYLV